MAYILLTGYEPFYGYDDHEIIMANKKGDFEFPLVMSSSSKSNCSWSSDNNATGNSNISDKNNADANVTNIASNTTENGGNNSNNDDSNINNTANNNDTTGNDIAHDCSSSGCMSDQAKGFIRQALQKSATDRITPQQALLHPWLSGFNNN